MSDTEVKEKLTAVFIDYTRQDGLSLAYHCVQCGYMYLAGHYGYECNGHIVCKERTTECPNCSRVLYIPLLWRHKHEAEVFAENEPGKTISLQLVPIEQMERSFVNLHEDHKHLH
jgi:hypothetical protein